MCLDPCRVVDVVKATTQVVDDFVGAARVLVGETALPWQLAIHIDEFTRDIVISQ
jgi:hypothetical protein